METFEHLRSKRLVLLTTRAEVRPAAGIAAVHRPVRISVDADGAVRLLTRTGGRLARRLDACGAVRLAPCDLRGRPTGSDQPAQAERQPYGGFGLPGGRWVRYLLTPANEPTPWSADRI
jgi:hypothetical protein